MKRCVILGAAPITDVTRIRSLLRDDDIVYAADGGHLLAKRLGLVPNLTVGDFDSSDKPQNGECVCLPREKDITDTHAVMQIAFERGTRNFLLLGCLGGRLDHQTAALLSARMFTAKGCTVYLADERNTVTVLLAGTYRLTAENGNFFSLFALSETVEGLCIRNAKYSLENYTLRSIDPLCVSNEMIGNDTEISFDNGELLLMYAKD